jgi:TolB-like protein
MAGMHAFGPFRLDAEAEILFLGADPVPLGHRALVLLRVLLEQPGRPISKDELITAAWGGQAVEDSNLTVQIAALRRALGTQPGGENWIETLPRRGYRFVGPKVALVSGPDSSRHETNASPLSLPDKPSIAVLPFQNMSADPEQEYFADGIVEDIITGLSRIRWLFVIARNSSFIYKGLPTDVRQVGRDLGVRYVLEGGLRKTADRIRISAQLIEAETGAHIWADRYDRLLNDIFSVQDEITLSVIGAVEPNLRKAEIERVKRKRPDNLDAYDLVLRALPYLYSAMPDGVATAIPLLQRAIAIEPSYARAHADLAWCFHHRFSRGILLDADRLAAVRHAHEAVAGGGDDPTTLAIAAFVIWLDEHDDQTATRLFDRALALSESNVFALGCSSVTLAWTGKSDLAIERAQCALRLSPYDPLNVRPYCGLAIAFFHARRYADAEEAARRASEFNPGFSVPYALRAAALIALGRKNEAIVTAQQVLALQPTFTISGFGTTIALEPAVFTPFAIAWREADLPQ